MPTSTGKFLKKIFSALFFGKFLTFGKTWLYCREVLKTIFLHRNRFAGAAETGIFTVDKTNEKFSVYLLMNRSLEEVFFGMVCIGGGADEELPSEIAHWDWQNHAIANPVMMAEELLFDEAVCEICTLQEKVKQNPQGKTLLENKSVVQA